MKGKKGFQKDHKSFKGTENTRFKKGGNIASANIKWKGDKAGVSALHIWVKTWKGKADHCEICGRNEKRMYHWANIDHSYRRVLDDYISMCVPCHRRYDYANNKK